MYFPVGLQHCVSVTTGIQSAVIVGLVLRLGPRDGEGGSVPGDGSINSQLAEIYKKNYTRTNKVEVIFLKIRKNSRFVKNIAYGKSYQQSLWKS